MAKEANTNKPPSGVPEQAEFGQMVAYLANEQGMNPAQIINAVGAQPNGRTREIITNGLIEWLSSQ
jgi:hypothetical protein